MSEHQPSQSHDSPTNQRRKTPHQEFREQCLELLAQSRAVAREWIKKIWKKPEIIDHEETEAWSNAVQYYKEFEVRDNVDYTEAIAHVKQLYERHDNADKLLDEKADAIIKYLGGGSALITLGALLSIKTDSKNVAILSCAVILSFLPSMVFGILAIHSAIKVRKPHTNALPPDARYAVQICEHYQTKTQIEPNLWLTYHPLCVAAGYRNLVKAKWVEDAHWYYKMAMAFLILPILVMAISLITTAASISDPVQLRQTQPGFTSDAKRQKL